MHQHIIARRGDDGAEDELLTTHSREVATLAPQLATDDLTGIASVVGRLHDLGKATTYFQRHVRGDPVQYKTRTYHARMGAFATFYVLRERDASERDQLAGLLAVLRHHGRLPNAAEALVDVARAERDRDDETRNSWVGEQLDDIADYDAGRAVVESLLADASNGAVSWESFVEAMTEGFVYDAIIDLVGEMGMAEWMVKPAPDDLPDALYDRTIRLWSTLTLADKTCSAGLMDDERLTPRSLALADLEATIEKKRTGLSAPPEYSAETTTIDLDVADEDSLNQVREALRRRVRENARAFATTDTQVATLTLPTGLGKTFTGITAAYTIRDILDHHELGAEHDPRVVYALPYTSIIEQTRDVFEGALNADPFSRAFTVHHYLSDTVTYPNVEADAGDQAVDDAAYFDAARFGESWRAGTTLTTFVQLFESLTGPTNARGLKLPALHDAVIVLDEPQTLPKSWWPAIRYLVDLLVTEYDAHVISMTATQPSLFTDADFETPSLLSGSVSADPPLERACFEAIERTTYRVHPSISDSGSSDGALNHDEAGSHLLSAVTDEDSDHTSALAVCNTIVSASELTDALRDAARTTGTYTRHLGDAYREALERTAIPVQGDKDVEDGSFDQRPDNQTLALETLDALGFEATDCAADDIEAWLDEHADNA